VHQELQRRAALREPVLDGVWVEAGGDLFVELVDLFADAGDVGVGSGDVRAGGVASVLARCHWGSAGLAAFGVTQSREVPWHRSGEGADAIEVAIIEARGETWVLMRLAGDGGLVHLFDRREWEYFVDAAKAGEFDEAAD
jgi:hypothetical protein